uniref:Uncharacterized protein n=1 Tax=Fagus sylvatica TaxID=28930 RepID=A0A2N9EHT2_FAGSY
MLEGHFLIEIPAKPGKILAIRELHVVAALVLFLKVPDLRINSQRVGKNLCAKVTSSGENVPDFQHNFLTFALVKLGQPGLWSNLVKPSQTLRNALPAMFESPQVLLDPSRVELSLIWAISFCVPTPEKISGYSLSHLCDLDPYSKVKQSGMETIQDPVISEANLFSKKKRRRAHRRKKFNAFQELPEQGCLTEANH